MTIDRNFDYLASLLGSAFGMDPFMLMIAGVLGVGGVGWLLGPFVGEGVFRAVFRREWGRMSVVRFCSPFFLRDIERRDYGRKNDWCRS